RSTYWRVYLGKVAQPITRPGLAHLRELSGSSWEIGPSPNFLENDELLIEQDPRSPTGDCIHHVVHEFPAWSILALLNPRENVLTLPADEPLPQVVLQVVDGFRSEHWAPRDDVRELWRNKDVVRSDLVVVQVRASV